MNRNQGFSLVELLVSLTLLSLIVFTGTLAYQTFSDYWAREKTGFKDAYKLARGASLLHTTLEDIKPYLVVENKQPYFYFEGGETVLRAIRQQAVTAEGPALFELITKSSETGEGLDLIYSELPLKQSNFQNIQRHTDNFSYQFILMTGIQDLSFSFFGWPHFNDFANQYSQDNRIDEQQWFGFYSAKDTWVTPTQVRVEVVMMGGKTLKLDVPVAAFRDDLIDYYLTGE
ncbi:hypothetical protein HMF8227_00713 [Saliniradius amylolyticus]|uniref:Prepilin-type N-terminal cleavage/methylation domain-containing protein n=1 Tax=Saliniradius amylolyticus TaxID=2183582 RepID=A0A2S2E0T8_9ALTE|nr:prepilin-type N-terminal cleavage/methylation domain-containing protein [Saliniradius amylolyticus]AWL11209.1 hypothetical protein HMF8227_00713 [Saliniradius amylolyticus]